MERARKMEETLFLQGNKKKKKKKRKWM
jgi:hypothetical protein